MDLRSSQTWHITTVTCSLLEQSVVSSAMTVIKEGSWHSEVISRSILRPITLITSFWMSGLVSAFILSSCWKLPSDSLPSSLSAIPCLQRILMDYSIWYNACLFLNFWRACCWESCSPISRVVEGRVTMTLTASHWQALFLRLIVAFFQLENPHVTYIAKFSLIFLQLLLSFNCHLFNFAHCTYMYIKL